MENGKPFAYARLVLYTVFALLVFLSPTSQYSPVQVKVGDTNVDCMMC